jgi:hypothetical protein
MELIRTQSDQSMDNNDPLLAMLRSKYGTDAIVTPLTDGSGAIVVLSMREDGSSNAIIVNNEGVPRSAIEIPSALRSGLGFTDAYYVKGELTAIYVYSTRDFACVVDEKTGNVIRYYETR